MTNKYYFKSYNDYSLSRVQSVSNVTDEQLQIVSPTLSRILQSIHQNELKCVTLTSKSIEMICQDIDMISKRQVDEDVYEQLYNIRMWLFVQDERNRTVVFGDNNIISYNVSYIDENDIEHWANIELDEVQFETIKQHVELLPPSSEMISLLLEPLKTDVYNCPGVCLQRRINSEIDEDLFINF